LTVFAFDLGPLSSKWPDARYLPLTETSYNSEIIEDLFSQSQLALKVRLFSYRWFEGGGDIQKTSQVKMVGWSTDRNCI